MFRPFLTSQTAYKYAEISSTDKVGNQPEGEDEIALAQ